MPRQPRVGNIGAGREQLRTTALRGPTVEQLSQLFLPGVFYMRIVDLLIETFIGLFLEVPYDQRLASSENRRRVRAVEDNCST